MCGGCAEGKGAAVIVAGESGCAMAAELARRMAAGGLRIFLAAAETREMDPVAAAICHGGGCAQTLAVDTTSEHDVAALFGQVVPSHALEIAAYTTCCNLPASWSVDSGMLLERLWRRSVYGAFLFGREAAKHMLLQRRGTLLFAGTAATPLARPPYSPFAIAKAGLRELTCGMAMEFAPHGVHVVDAVQDGLSHGSVRAKSCCPPSLVERCWEAHREPTERWTHQIRV